MRCDGAESHVTNGFFVVNAVFLLSLSCLIQLEFATLSFKMLHFPLPLHLSRVSKTMRRRRRRLGSKSCSRTRQLLPRIVVYNPVRYHEQYSAPPSFFLIFPAQRRRPRHAAPCNRSAPRCSPTRLQKRNIIVCCKLLLLLLLLLLFLPNCTLSSPPHALPYLQRTRARF